MKSPYSFLISCFAIAFTFFLNSPLDLRAAEPVKKKLIELGWDIPTTEYLAKHWREMEENAPFDGVIYDLVGKSPDGAQYASQRLFTKDAWNREWFNSCVEDLKSCQFERFHDNFIRINFYPADFDWADDEAWNNVCEKAAVCAWVARETGGNLCFDFESYGAQMFKHNASTGRSFEESKRIARRRGAEMCAAIVKEYPEVTILCLWMNSINVAAGRSPKPDLILRDFSYGLLPSFIDGLLDSVVPETILIDGCENGYYLNGNEYDRAACDVFLETGPSVALVAPENRKKYRTQTRVGFGFYLDMYSNPEGSRYYRGPEEGETRFERLEINLRAALNAADQYVWVYGEQKRWWAPDDHNKPWTSWEEALPGLSRLIDELNNPQKVLQDLKKRVLDDKSSVNLARNADFERVDANGRPLEWSTWQIETNPTGEFVAENGAAVIKHAVNAVYIQSIPVEPGQRYFVTCKASEQGENSAGIRIRWNDSDGRWTQQSLDVLSFIDPSSDPDEQGRREIVATAVVPDKAYKLVLLLTSSGGDPNGSASFDDVRIYRVDD